MDESTVSSQVSQEGFLVERGSRIVVPTGVSHLFVRSRHAKEPADQHNGMHLQTPIIAYLWQCQGNTGRFCFASKVHIPTRTHLGSYRAGGLVMFIPDGVKAGDVLDVQCRDEKCLCAIKISA